MNTAVSPAVVLDIFSDFWRWLYLYEDFFEWLRILDLSIGLCKMNLYHKNKHKQNNNKKTSIAGSLTQKLKDILLMTNTILCGLKKNS